MSLVTRRRRRKKRKYVSDDDVTNAKKEIWARNEYEFVEVDTRSILLCGRTRSGKTTAMNVLKEPCYTPKRASIFSETKDARFYSFSIQNNVKGAVQKFNINVIDTPGLFEVTQEKGTERTNKRLVDIISKCLENEITGIHAVFFFATFEAGINNDDIEAMEIFLRLFDGGNIKKSLVITHADKHDDLWKDDILGQLSRHQSFEELIKVKKLDGETSDDGKGSSSDSDDSSATNTIFSTPKSRFTDDEEDEEEGEGEFERQRKVVVCEDSELMVLFMGCVDPRMYSNVDDLSCDYEDVYLMREDMLNYIFKASHRGQLNQMNIVKNKIKEVKKCVKDCTENFKYFLAQKDFGIEACQKRIVAHQEEMKKLCDSSAFTNIPSLAGAFHDFVGFAKQVSEREDVSKEIRAKLIWPLAIDIK